MANPITRVFRRQANKVKNHDSIIDTEINKLNRASKEGIISTGQKDRFLNMLKRIDMKQNVRLLDFEIEELEEPSWLVPSTLYKQGVLMFFKVGQKLVFTPCTISAWKYNGGPLEVQPVPIYPSKLIDTSKKYIVGVDAVLLYDGTPVFEGAKPVPRIIETDIIIDQMAAILSKLNINISLAGDKVYIEVENIESAKEVQKWLTDQIGSDSPVVVSARSLNTQPLVQSAQTKFDELTSLLKEFDTLRQIAGGFGEGNYGIHKKERLITDEVEQSSQSPDLVFKDREKCLEDFIKQMESVLQVTVTYNKEVEQNGREDQRDGTVDTESSESTSK